MKNKIINLSWHKLKGFTLTEFLVAVIIGAIILLSVTTLSGISQNSYEHIRQESGTYGEILSGLELMKNEVRKTNGGVAIENWDSTWKSQVLVVGSSAFGVHQSNSTAPKSFVYLKDKTNPTAQDVIFSLTSANMTNEALSLNFSQTSTLVTARVQGRKYIPGKEQCEPFDLQTSVSQRN